MNSVERFVKMSKFIILMNRSTVFNCKNLCTRLQVAMTQSAFYYCVNASNETTNK